MKTYNEVFISRAALEQRNALGLTRKQVMQLIVNECGRRSRLMVRYDGREPGQYQPRE